MKLFGCTMVKNEEEMIPYVMPYVERLGYDKFVVYDDSSTDNTVAELKKYPFVEIRMISTSDEMWEKDNKKRDLQVQFYCECWKYIIEHDNEEVWMTFTDFDEVIYCSGRNDFKIELNAYNSNFQRVYLNKPMVQIIGNMGGGLKENVPQLIHTSPNIVVNNWNLPWSEKVVLFKVNAVEEIACHCGNHAMTMRLSKEYKELREKKDITLNTVGIFHTFHLKWVNYSILKEKINSTSNKAIKDLDSAYKNMLASSYPISQYFANDALYCALKSKGENITFL